MKTIILVILNLGLAALFIYLLRRRQLLSYHHQGRWWLTWPAVGVITLMDEFTSIFCVPAEVYRFIGLSAIAKVTSFSEFSEPVKMILALGIIWAVAGLNILGIRETARFTFMIFIAPAIVLLNLIVSGLTSMDAESLGQHHKSFRLTAEQLHTGTWTGDYSKFISHIAFCILAYSGVESVLQTAGLVRTWQEIRKAYLFLGLTVGIVTPLLAALALSAPIDFHLHEGDLITHYASLLNGLWFGVIVAALASFTLTMAVNTAFVASGELMERVAHRYSFHWLIATNCRQSLHRVQPLSLPPHQDQSLSPLGESSESGGI